MNNHQFRLGVGIILYNQDKQVFVGQRIDTAEEAWQMPQGGIDEGEDIEAAAYRELYEETGISKEKVGQVFSHESWFTYMLPTELAEKLWDGKYIGQKQKWFAMEFKGSDADINLNASQHPEFNSWKWVSLHQVPDLIIPFKKELYKNIVKEFQSVVDFPWL